MMKARAQTANRALPVSRPAGVRMSVVVVSRRDELSDHLAAYEDLALSAIEPNVFYDPWMLLPALESFGRQRQLVFVLVYATDFEERFRTPFLCGFFPLERLGRYQGLQIPILTLWKYVHCYLCTPLLRAGYASEALTVFLNWVSSNPRLGMFMEFPHVTATGPFHQALVDALRKRSWPMCTRTGFSRALFQPMEDTERYLKAVLSRKSRKELRRQRRRLAEMGRLEFTELEPNGNVEQWVGEFLRVESMGWKGRAGTALGSSEADRRFFLSAATEAFRRGRLMMIDARLDGRAIAVKCSLLAGEGSFAFKISFDERYRKFSPGVLLEIETIDRLHKRPGIRWMDSCADPNHFMANRLWADRRAIETVLVAIGRPWSNFLVTAMRQLGWLVRAARRAA